MARRSFLLYSTVQVKCPKDWTEAQAESAVAPLQKWLEEQARELEEKINSGGLDLKVEVMH